MERELPNGRMQTSRGYRVVPRDEKVEDVPSLLSAELKKGPCRRRFAYFRPLSAALVTSGEDTIPSLQRGSRHTTLLTFSEFT